MATLEFEEILTVFGIGGESDHSQDEEHDHRRRRTTLDLVSGVGRRSSSREKRATDDHDAHDHAFSEGTNVSEVKLLSLRSGIRDDNEKIYI